MFLVMCLQCFRLRKFIGGIKSTTSSFELIDSPTDVSVLGISIFKEEGAVCWLHCSITFFIEGILVKCNSFVGNLAYVSDISLQTLVVNQGNDSCRRASVILEFGMDTRS